MKAPQFVVMHIPGRPGSPVLDELRAFAAADPAVRSGLLTFERRPGLVGMQR